MKKNCMAIFALITVLMVLSGFWGCNSGGDDGGETAPGVSVYSGFDSSGTYVSLT
jgi:hypothetical protein